MTASSPHDSEHELDPEWEALLRGTIISTTTQKFFNYVSLADQKAQAMIILNSILVPVIINWADKPGYEWGVMIALGSAISSILLSIICIYPKRRSGKKPDGSINYLHFGDIGRISEQEYLKRMKPIFNDNNQLSEASLKDLHDVARRIILPKFFWLKCAYAVFFFGNLAAIICVLWVMQVS